MDPMEKVQQKLTNLLFTNFTLPVPMSVLLGCKFTAW
jgi:hypothetical protein